MSVSDKAAHVAQVWERAGVYTRCVDMDEYPPIVGMEGPFHMGRDMSFRVLYYDTCEGKYYDRKTDLYVEVG